MVKLEDLKPADWILLDNGFICVPEGVYEVKSMDGRLYFDCSLGEHYLDGCEECGTLVGVLNVLR